MYGEVADAELTLTVRAAESDKLFNGEAVADGVTCCSAEPRRCSDTKHSNELATDRHVSTNRCGLFATSKRTQAIVNQRPLTATQRGMGSDGQHRRNIGMSTVMIIVY